MKRLSFLLILSLQVFIAGPLIAMDKQISSIGPVKEEIKPGEILEYEYSYTLPINPQIFKMLPRSQGEIQIIIPYSPNQATAEQRTPPLWYGNTYGRNYYLLRIKGINGCKVKYEMMCENFRINGRSLFEVEEFIAVPGKTPKKEELPLLGEKLLERASDFLYPRLPLFWLYLPPMKQGEEIKIEWEPYPAKFYGIKPPLASVKFLGIQRKGNKELAEYEVKCSNTEWEGTFRLVYDLKLKKFTELHGTFKKPRILEPLKALGLLETDEVKVDNYLLLE